MHKQRHIVWKALLMLVSFTASFTVFCHCEAAPGCQKSCCEKKKKDDDGCQGMAAVQFNLQAKQATAAIHLDALPMILMESEVVKPPLRQPAKGFRVFWSYKHSPPDRQSLYQCFLI